MVSILHPTRSRPKQSFDTMKRWVERAASDDLEIIVSIDTDDPFLAEYYNQYQNFLRPFTWVDAPNKSSVEAINRAARLAQGDIIIVVSDDQDCPINWLPKIARYTKGLSDFVLKVKDGFQHRIITMPIVDRVYFNRFGYIYNPGYSHLWADTEFTEVAMRLKKVISKNITFLHNQYSIIGTKPDQINDRNNATYEPGKKFYLERKRINFGL